MKLSLPLLLGLAGFALAGPTPKIVKPLSPGPIEYFENQCARCHGTRGSNFVVASLKRRSPASLKAEIQSMASGPGQSPISGRDLDAQVALHRSIIKGTPFLSFTKSANGVLSGEVVGSEIVAIKYGTTRIPAKVADGVWTARVPLSWLSPTRPIFVVSGTSKGMQAAIDLTASPTSVRMRIRR